MLGWVQLVLWLSVAATIVAALVLDFIHGGIAGTVYVGIEVGIIAWYAREFVLTCKGTDDERV